MLCWFPPSVSPAYTHVSACLEFHPSRSLQSIEWGSVCCTVYVLISYPFYIWYLISLSHFTLGDTLSVHSTSLPMAHLCSFLLLSNIPLSSLIAQLVQNLPAMQQPQLHSTVCMHHSFFIHCFFSGSLGCFHALAIANGSAGKLGYMYFFELCFRLGICPIV